VSLYATLYTHYKILKFKKTKKEAKNETNNKIFEVGDL